MAVKAWVVSCVAELGKGVVRLVIWLNTCLLKPSFYALDKNNVITPIKFADQIMCH